MDPLRSAVVTGASRGLGAVIARRLAGDGWAVALGYRSGRETTEALVAEIRATGGEACAVGADITTEEGTRALVDAAAELAPVGLVVANATGPQPETPLESLSWRDHLDQLEVLVLSPTLLVQAALPALRTRGGSVMLIGSDMADRAPAGWAAYVAAKNAQVGLVKVWAKELGPDQITVNLIAPGWIPVERHEGEDTSTYASEVPLGRTGDPDDVAGLVAFLASDAGRFITGQRIAVNGGHVL